MRNSPLWRPQPTSYTTLETASAEPGKLQRNSILLMTGLGLAIATGIGAVSFLGFADELPPAMAEAAVASPPLSAPKQADDKVQRAEPVPAPKQQAATPPPAVQPAPVDVAIAYSEFDVARLEEMTGMVPVAPARGPDDRSPVIAPDTPVEQTDALAELRPAVDPAPVSVASESLAENAADTSTETASILTDQPTIEPSPPQPSSVEPPSDALPDLTATKVTRYVNMRSGPADEARTITIVPAGAIVQAEANCGWCLVTYEGKRGYIYKSFLGRGGISASSGKPVQAPSKKPGLY